MGRIPEYKSKAPVTAEVGGVMADQAIDAVRYERGMAARAGNVLSKEANDYLSVLRLNEAQLQASEGKLESYKRHKEALDEFENNTNPTQDENGNLIPADWEGAHKTLSEKLKQIRTDILSKKGLLPKAKEYLSREIDDLTMKTTFDAGAYSRKKIIAEQKARKETLIDEYIRLGKFADAHADNAAALSGGIYNREDFEKIEKKIREGKSEALVRSKLEGLDPEQALTALSSFDYEKAGLSKAGFNEIKAEYRMRWTVEKHHEQEQRRQKEEAQSRNGFIAEVKYLTGDLKPEDVVNLVKNGEIKAEAGKGLLADFGRDIKDAQKEAKEARKEELQNIYFQNYSTLLKEVDGVLRGTKDLNQTFERIKEWRRDGHLDNTYAKSLTDRLMQQEKADTPLKRPDYLNKLAVMDKIREVKNNSAAGDVNTILKNDRTWSNKRTQFTQWMEANPQATTEEVNRKFDEFYKEEKQEFSWRLVAHIFGAENVYDKVFPGTKTAQAQTPEQAEAIAFLKKNNKQVSEKNINEYLRQKKAK